MPLEKVDTQIDFPALERRILEFWNNTHAFEKLIELNRGKPKWSFLDGPITANNPMGVHHAWGRTYKDAYQRYFAMTGHELRYQNGFDCQGLWVEVEVEKEMKLQSKRDIENLVAGDAFASIDKFVCECKQRVDKFAKVQTEQSIRLGYWMDWDRDEDWAKPPDQRRSYFTMAEVNNYTIWSFLKKCHERELIFRGYDAMPWCPRCSVGLSQMEMAEGYQMVAHRAVFVKFPIRPSPGVRYSEPQGSEYLTQGLREYLLVWTTTPWTLTSNVAAAVNPELTYLKVKHKDEIYYLAKGAFQAQRLEEQFKKKEWVEGVPKLKTLEQVFKEKGGYEILGEISGAQMIGWKYAGPFDELPAQQSKLGFPLEVADAVQNPEWATGESAAEAHRVIAWKDVGAAEGTGIVHIAPGCGKEDFLLSKDESLPLVAPLDEYGVFIDGFGPLAGKSAIEPATTDFILANLQEKHALFAVEKYPHSYPHCWRCKTELLFRLVDEWFIDMKWRDEIMRVVEKVTFLPESINGKAREMDWLKNMGDWMISKKRFWGLALPIWVCDACGEFDVIGSREELKQRAVEGWDKFEGHPPHRPWIDLVKIACPACGLAASRIIDVGNPWLDAGIVPFSTMKYNSDRAYWNKWFPADFITESFPGQFRNWFYAILAMSTMIEQRAPCQVLFGHAQVRDQKGEEMHKSKGNAIPFDGAADEGYKLFHDRDPKLKLDAQAHKDLPEGWLDGSIKEETALLDNKPRPVVSASYAPIGADVIRWLYCRQNPAQNINFGPEPAEELRAKFVLKLWNTYAFFCNYARLDKFDPSSLSPRPEGEGLGVRGPQVPVKDRPDIDRWILSDLQLLIRKARASFEAFNVMAFCLEVESFVDDKLSNWYVRRNRRRFWKSEQGPHKLAAYQTLYTVLDTLTRLIAPFMPFLSEAMYQNLVMGGGWRVAGETASSRSAEFPPPASVHHAAYPGVNATLIDAPLSTDMDALLRLVSLGSAARNQVKIKVRQPLAELKVQPGDDAERRAVDRFADQICEELNVKKVSLHDACTGPLLCLQLKPNPKNLGPKRIKLAVKYDSDEAARKLWGTLPIQCPNADGVMVDVTREDFFVSFRGAEGWAGVVDKDTQVAIDTRITPELARDGMARDVIRQVQDSRKKAGLEMEDRIALFLQSDDAELMRAIDDHRAYIAGECLIAEWSNKALTGNGVFRAQVKVDGRPLQIELKRAETVK